MVDEVLSNPQGVQRNQLPPTGHIIQNVVQCELLKTKTAHQVIDLRSKYNDEVD